MLHVFSVWMRASFANVTVVDFITMLCCQLSPQGMCVSLWGFFYPPSPELYTRQCVSVFSPQQLRPFLSGCFLSVWTSSHYEPMNLCKHIIHCINGWTKETTKNKKKVTLIIPQCLVGFKNKLSGHVALAQKGKVERNLPVGRGNNKSFKRNYILLIIFFFLWRLFVCCLKKQTTTLIAAVISRK